MRNTSFDNEKFLDLFRDFKVVFESFLSFHNSGLPLRPKDVQIIRSTNLDDLIIRIVSDNPQDIESAYKELLKVAKSIGLNLRRSMTKRAQFQDGDIDLVMSLRNKMVPDDEQILMVINNFIDFLNECYSRCEVSIDGNIPNNLITLYSEEFERLKSLILSLFDEEQFSVDYGLKDFQGALSMVSKEFDFFVENNLKGYEITDKFKYDINQDRESLLNIASQAEAAFIDIKISDYLIDTLQKSNSLDCFISKPDFRPNEIYKKLQSLPSVLSSMAGTAGLAESTIPECVLDLKNKIQYFGSLESKLNDIIDIFNSEQKGASNNTIIKLLKLVDKVENKINQSADLGIDIYHLEYRGKTIESILQTTKAYCRRHGSTRLSQRRFFSIKKTFGLDDYRYDLEALLKSGFLKNIFDTLSSDERVSIRRFITSGKADYTDVINKISDISSRSESKGDESKEVIADSYDSISIVKVTFKLYAIMQRLQSIYFDISRDSSTSPSYQDEVPNLLLDAEDILTVLKKFDDQKIVDIDKLVFRSDSLERQLNSFKKFFNTSAEDVNSPSF